LGLTKIAEQYTTIEACSTPSGTPGLPEGGAAASDATCYRRSRVSDFTGAVRLNLDRIELSGEGGRRVGLDADVPSDSRLWGSGALTMWLAPRAALVVGGGKQPSNPARGIPARTFGSVALSFASAWPKKSSVPVTEVNLARIAYFEAKPIAAGMQKIVVRVAR